ncbi:MAG: YncE family protein [Acidobacteria bacterium]|nr:YncE family protein [Acidobacteriota bacterium]
MKFHRRISVISACWLVLLAVTVKGQYDQDTVQSGTFNFESYTNPVITPDGRWAFIANPMGDSLVRVDLFHLTFTAWPTADNPAAVSLSPDGQLVAVVNVGLIPFSGDTVYIFDGLSDETTPLSIFNPPANFGYYNQVVFTNDNRYAFVAARHEGVLYAFDPPSGQLVAHHVVGLQPTHLAISPDNRRLIMLYNQSGFLYFAIFDLEQFYATETFQLIALVSTQSVYQDATTVDFTPDSRYVLVPNYSNGRILMVDIDTGVIQQQVTVGAGPVSLTVDPVLDRAYSVNVLANNISIIDMATWTGTNHGFANAGFHPDNRPVIISHRRTGMISAGPNNRLLLFDALDGTLQNTYFTGNRPEGIAVNPSGCAAAVVSADSDRLDILTRDQLIDLRQVDITSETNQGFALVNTDPAIVNLQLAAYADGGGPAQAQRFVNVNGHSVLVREWTSEDLNLPNPFSGWARFASPLSDLKGFAMFYRRDVHWLDGLGYDTVPDDHLIIPWVHLDTDRINRLHISNPRDMILRIEATLHAGDSNGFARQFVDLPAQGRTVVDDLAGMFGVEVPYRGFLVLTASASFHAQLEFGDHDARALLSGEPVGRRIGNRIVLPHFAEGDGWKSRVLLTNTGDVPLNVQVDMYLEDSGGVPVVAPVNIPAKDQVVREVWDLLNMDPPDTLRSGWLSLGGDLVGLQAAILFETEDGQLLSTLPGQAVPRLRHFISHVAQDMEYFTGLAFVNDSGQTVDVDVNVYDEQGILVVSTRIISLLDRAKFVRLLSDDPFLLNQQLGGYIQIVSSRPIFCYALFGIGDTFLSAIPSQ